MKRSPLIYDTQRYTEKQPAEVNTLQLFITNRCNLRCKGCFYQHRLGREDMTLDDYHKHLLDYNQKVDKVVLLGGEPTLHPHIADIIKSNQVIGLKTTIYTNGARLDKLEGLCLDKVKIRLGVYGAYSSEKPLDKARRTRLPISIVYLLRKDNIYELDTAARMAEDEFNCTDFFISSIRDVADTGSYWKDNDDTIPVEQYRAIVQEFLDRYSGKLDIHISRRSTISSEDEQKTDHCRFGNIFPDGTKIQCPFDIALEKRCDDLTFGERKCNKDRLCILRKTIFKNKKGDKK